MFVRLLKSLLEKNKSTTGCLLIFSAAFLFAPAINAGVYQRTRDGKTLVWNNFPSGDDVVIWSGKRDANGYATGKGTLTWYKTEKAFLTGSLLPGKGGAAGVTTYSGTMVHGKLNGLVVNVDPNGKRSRLTFADGIKTRGKAGAPETSPGSSANQRVKAVATAPGEGPASSPTAKEAAKKIAAKERKVEAEKESHVAEKSRTPAEDRAVDNSRSTAENRASAESATPVENPPPAEGPAPVESPAPVVNSALRPKIQPTPASEQPTVELASNRSTPPPAPPPSRATETDSEVKDRIVADLKDETQTVLSQVGEATDHFRSADRLDSVAKLPGPVSENVSALVQHARDFRGKIGYETALRDYRTETETVDALAAVDQATHNITANDVASAKAKLTDFLKSNPEPSADAQQPLWQYLHSMQQLCSRLQRDATVHSQRAESFAAANRTSEAIREYQEAYRIFPNPATAEKIRQLQANSLGL